MKVFNFIQFISPTKASYFYAYEMKNVVVGKLSFKLINLLQYFDIFENSNNSHESMFQQVRETLNYLLKE